MVLVHMDVDSTSLIQVSKLLVDPNNVVCLTLTLTMIECDVVSHEKVSQSYEDVLEVFHTSVSAIGLGFGVPA